MARTQIEMAVLRDFCRVALGASAPVGIVQMKALPRNENGKIMRERLVDLTLHLMRQAAGETSSPR
ncbi:MAG: hypothetical protein JSS43_32200 [Proteobacteria bacterium]|nr:hypothetical protein [Pseudomonadota bacterium]